MSKACFVFLAVFLVQIIYGQLPPQKCVFDSRQGQTPKCSCTCRDGTDGRDGRDGRDGYGSLGCSKEDSGITKELKQLQDKVKDMEEKLKKMSELENTILNFREARASKDTSERKAEITKQKYMKAYKKEQEMLELFNVTKPTASTSKNKKKPENAIPDLHGKGEETVVKINGDGKIPQSVLPGGFDKASATDIQWQALHMSAASACRGVSKTGGHPGIHNVVLLRNANEGKTCRQLCSKSWADKCEGEVSIWGMLGKGAKNGQEIGNFYNYGCDYGNGGGSEADVNPDAITEDMKEAHQYYFSYCCCSFY